MSFKPLFLLTAFLFLFFDLVFCREAENKAVPQGKINYLKNCFFCHGNNLDGQGPFAWALNPKPANLKGFFKDEDAEQVFEKIFKGNKNKGGIRDFFYPQAHAFPTPLSDKETKEVLNWLKREAQGSVGLESGKEIYSRNCAQCHGGAGRGDGFLAPLLSPKPWNLASGKFKFRSTKSGAFPLDQDLFRTLSQGLPGTAMPAFKGVLSQREMEAVVSYIKELSAIPVKYNQEALVMKRPPDATPELLEKGRQTYQRYRCFECHGAAGRGDGPSAVSLHNDNGEPSAPRNLREYWNFKGGFDVSDVYRTLTTGISGTPMFSMEGVEPDPEEDESARWALAHYVVSIFEKPVKEGLAGPVAFLNNKSADDFEGMFNAQEESALYLSGQVYQEPRLYAPAVSLVWAQVLAQDDGLCLTARWSDRTLSRGGGASLPDSFSIALMPEAEVLDPEAGARLFTWQADFDKIKLQNWQGKELSTPLKNQARFRAEHLNGEWKLLIFLSWEDLERKNRDERESFKAVFFVGDGGSQESGFKRAVSSVQEIRF